MINLIVRPIVSELCIVKPQRIHKFIHSFCGKLWKSPKDKQLVQKITKADYCKGWSVSNEWPTNGCDKNKKSLDAEQT